MHDKVLVALSGGADSVALLRVLLVLGYHCEAAHCNFHLRGEESDRDERFVNELCKGLGVALHVTHLIRSLMLRGIMFLLRWRLAKCAMIGSNNCVRRGGGLLLP